MTEATTAKKMIWLYLAGGILVAVFGLLIAQRLHTQPSLIARIVDTENSAHKVGEIIRRGETLTTQPNEHLLVQIGDSLRVGMDERSTLEFWKLFDKDVTLRFKRGRLFVDNPSVQPVFVETNKTENSLVQGQASFINYDFKQLVTVAPLVGSVQTRLKNSNEFLVVPSALNISEGDTPTFSKTAVDVTQGLAADFYTWVMHP
ncbi:hypothetical protein HZA85_03705 [Candidatus Uhrbacteria bacterium]|nr:hypothetical protein [Candidatus Uhrbacteria bacterium]